MAETQDENGFGLSVQSEAEPEAMGKGQSRFPAAYSTNFLVAVLFSIDSFYFLSYESLIQNPSIGNSMLMGDNPKDTFKKKLKEN